MTQEVNLGFREIAGKTFGIPALVAAILFTVPVLASAAKDPGFTIGPSLGYVASQKELSGMAYGLDVTYAIPSKETVYWASTGLRYIDAGSHSTLAYVEAGGWLLANLGVGYSYSLDSFSAARHYVHGFLGIPVPLYGMGTRGKLGIYLEPYYRPTFPISEKNSATLHEFGILIKFTRIKLGAGTNPNARQ